MNHLRRLPQHPIFKASIEGFKNELKAFFPDKSVTVNQIKVEGDLASIAKSNPTWKPPFFLFKINTQEPEPTPRFNSSLRRHGIITKAPVPRQLNEDGFFDKPKDPRENYKIAYISEIQLSMSVYLVAVFEDIYDFASMWLQASKSNYLNFKIEVDNASFPIRFDLGSSVNYPDIDPDDTQKLIVIQIDAIMHTFSGVMNAVKPIRSYKVSGYVTNENVINENPDETFVLENADGGPFTLTESN